MKLELKQITNLTINELLNKDIILPSLYFESFSNNAKKVEINLEDKSFNFEVEKILVEEYLTIETYMKSIINNAEFLSTTAKEAKNALINKDVENLNEIYKKMIKLEKEVQKLNKKLFIDEITKTNNKKWIYSKFLDENACFKEEGITTLININNFEYIKEEYGELISNNLLIFMTNFINRHLSDENIDFKIARFFEDKFLIFIECKKEEKIHSMIKNINKMLYNTTLKSNSGLLIKAHYNFHLEEYKKGQNSKEIFEKLLSYKKEE